MSVVAPLVYEALPSRVVFGPGAIGAIGAEVARLGGERVLLLDGPSDPGPGRRLVSDLGPRHAGTIEKVIRHVPTDLAAAATDRARELGADCLLALGGGSAIGLAKAIALQTGLPIVAVPTTYAGSEMTPIWGTTAAARKTTGRDLRVLPRVVVYDPELTLLLPKAVSATSGMNAVAHCVEALWAPAANPLTDAVAGEGIAQLAGGLREVMKAPGDLGGRVEALRGAWLAGTALAAAGTGLHHKLCHVLGGTFDLPHSEVHAVVLPWVVEYYCEEVPDAMARIAAALGTDDAVAGLRLLARDLGIDAGLGEFGLTSRDLDLAAELAAASAPSQPIPADERQIRAILENAMVGAGTE